MIEMKPGEIVTTEKGEIVIVTDEGRAKMVRQFRKIAPRPPKECQLIFPKSTETIVLVRFREMSHTVKRYLHSLGDEAGECFNETLVGRNNAMKIVEAAMAGSK